MLKLNACNMDKVIDRPITNGFTIGAEGMPCVSIIEDNVETVKPSTGTSADIFSGVSFRHNVMPSVISEVLEITIPSASPYTVQLSPNILAGQIHIDDLEEDTAAADKFQLVDATGVLTFHADNAGETHTVTLRRTPSTIEAAAKYPDADININKAFEFLGSIGQIQAGEVLTDQFDASADWATGGTLKTGAGVFTLGGDGATISGKITRVPTADVPFLGITFSVH